MLKYFQKKAKIYYYSSNVSNRRRKVTQPIIILVEQTKYFICIKRNIYIGNKYIKISTNKTNRKKKSLI